MSSEGCGSGDSWLLTLLPVMSPALDELRCHRPPRGQAIPITMHSRRTGDRHLILRHSRPGAERRPTRLVTHAPHHCPTSPQGFPRRSRHSRPPISSTGRIPMWTPPNRCEATARGIGLRGRRSRGAIGSQPRRGRTRPSARPDRSQPSRARVRRQCPRPAVGLGSRWARRQPDRISTRPRPLGQCGRCRCGTTGSLVGCASRRRDGERRTVATVHRRSRYAGLRRGDGRPTR